MKFQTVDLLLVTAVVAVYIPMFIWGYATDLPSALMIAGGSVLFVGRVSQAFLVSNYELHKRMDLHFRLWMALALIGILAIVARAFV